MKKVKITKLPKFKDGSIVRQFGLQTPPNDKVASPTSGFVRQGGKGDIKINRVLKPTDKENATLEAEKGETVVTDLNNDGIPEFYTIGGKRHYAGGTPLNLPSESFIFSRDKNLKISDPDILQMFGKTDKKSYTPAELSKTYANTIYREMLANPSSDHIMVDTAEQMIKNYNLKLGALALAQESKKGFPEGFPGIAIPYMEANGINPSELVGTQNAPTEEAVEIALYGGVSKYRDGGFVKFQDGGITDADIIQMLKYESRAGSSSGSGLSNYGIKINKWGKKYDYLLDGVTEQEAIDFIRAEYLPAVADFPANVQKRVIDYAYNTGRNPYDLLLLENGDLDLQSIRGASDPELWEAKKEEILKKTKKKNYSKSLDQTKHDLMYDWWKDPNLGNDPEAYEKSSKGRIDMWNEIESGKVWDDKTNTWTTRKKANQNTNVPLKTGEKVKYNKQTGAFEIVNDKGENVGKLNVPAGGEDDVIATQSNQPCPMVVFPTQPSIPDIVFLPVPLPSSSATPICAPSTLKSSNDFLNFGSLAKFCRPIYVP